MKKQKTKESITRDKKNCKVKDRYITLLKERNSELQNKKEKATVE